MAVNGMRIYGVYKFENHPEWNVLVTDFRKYNGGKIVVLRGLAFLENGDFETIVELDIKRLEKNPVEIGYVYGEGRGTLHLINLC